jgi:hypothetical protein
MHYPLLVSSEIFSPNQVSTQGWDCFFSPHSLLDWLEAWLLPAALEALFQTGHTTRSSSKLLELAQSHAWQVAGQEVWGALLALKQVPAIDLKVACLAFGLDFNRCFGPTPTPHQLLIYRDLHAAGEAIWEQMPQAETQLGDRIAWLALCEQAQTDADALFEMRLRF